MKTKTVLNRIIQNRPDKKFLEYFLNLPIQINDKKNIKKILKTTDKTDENDENDKTDKNIFWETLMGRSEKILDPGTLKLFSTALAAALTGLIFSLSLPFGGLALTQETTGPRKGLCGTCKLSIANTGRILYKKGADQSPESANSFGPSQKSSAQDNAPLLMPEPKSAAYRYEKIVLGTERNFKLLRFDNKAMLLEKAVVKALGDHCIIWVDKNIEVGDNQALMTAYQFDDVIYDTVRLNFGYEPNTGIDGDSRVNILLTDIKDPLDGPTFVRGYYNPADLHLTDNDNTTSNEMEVLYIDAVNQEPGKVEYFRTIAHQFCHMVLYNMDTSMGTIGTREHLWIDEGMCLLAEYLCGYSHPHEYIESYLNDTNTSLVMSDVRDWAADTPWKNYGASYLFVLYVYEHFGKEFIRHWAATHDDGISGFNKAMQSSGRSDTFDTVFADWIMANLIDDVSVKDIATYGNFGYRTIDLDLIVPADSRFTRFPCKKTGEQVKYYGAQYYLFHDTEASYLDITVDGTDEIGELFVRNMVINSADEMLMDPLFVINNPTKTDLYEYNINVPRFGSTNMEVFVAVSNFKTSNPGDYNLYGSIAGPRFSVFFNPVFPHYVTVSIYSREIPHAYVQQHKMTADLSIMLNPLRDNLYQGSYPIDPAFPGTAVFTATGTGPDKTKGTIKWKMDIINIAPDTKADIFFEDISLKSSAVSYSRTMAASTQAVELSDPGLTPLGQALVFTCFNSAPVQPLSADAGPALKAGAGTTENFEITFKNKAREKAGIYRLENNTPVFVSALNKDSSLTAQINLPGTYLAILDESGPEIINRNSLEPLYSSSNEWQSIQIKDSGSGLNREKTLFILENINADADNCLETGADTDAKTGRIIEPDQWVESAQTPGLVQALFKNPGGTIKVIPRDKAGNTGPVKSLKALASLSVIPGLISYPNPARTYCDIEVSHSFSGINEIIFSIFDKSGHIVNKINAYGPLGMEKARWDLTSDQGRPVANGVYIVRADIHASPGAGNSAISSESYRTWCKVAVLR
jgi:hypothetical protein